MPIFGPWHSPYSNYLCREPDIAAVGTIFNVLSYDPVLDRDSNLSPSRRRSDALCVEPWSRVQFWHILETNPVKSFVFMSIWVFVDYMALIKSG